MGIKMNFETFLKNDPNYDVFVSESPYVYLQIIIQSNYWEEGYKLVLKIDDQTHSKSSDKNG